MPLSPVVQRRLRNLGLAHPAALDPAGVVRRLLAVQAQDFAGSKWAVGMRGRGLRDAHVERAYDRGKILRTHVLRPTWHYVAPDDLRWLLGVTAPRVHQVNGTMYRRLELDESTRRRGQEALVTALEGGRALTRTEAADVFERAGIPGCQGQRLAYMVMAAELDAVVCSGPRRGKQHTYALLDERAPGTRALPRDEALAELARRFFTTRGPATVHDLGKWATLTVGDARRAVESVAGELARETIEGGEYWSGLDEPADDGAGPVRGTHLVSVFDEYLGSYKGFDFIADPTFARRYASMGASMLYVLLVEGRITGAWARTVGPEGVNVALELFRPLSMRETRAVEAAAQRYGSFLQLPVRLVPSAH